MFHRTILPFLIYWAYRLCYASVRLHWVNHEGYVRRWRDREGLILGVWHGQLYLLLGAFRGHKLGAIVSQSRDGDLMASVLRRFRFPMARGSTTHGGVRALLGYLKMMRGLRNGCFAVDGPRGPIHEIKPGIIYSASRLGFPIIPIVGVCSNPLVFEKAWDQAHFPKPFSRVVVAFGEPLHVPAKLNSQGIERHRQRLERSMVELGRRASDCLERELGIEVKPGTSPASIPHGHLNADGSERQADVAQRRENSAPGRAGGSHH